MGTDLSSTIAWTSCASFWVTNVLSLPTDSLIFLSALASNRRGVSSGLAPAPPVAPAPPPSTPSLNTLKMPVARTRHRIMFHDRFTLASSGRSGGDGPPDCVDEAKIGVIGRAAFFDNVCPAWPLKKTA